MPLDLGARDSATVGGLVARTPAGRWPSPTGRCASGWPGWPSCCPTGRSVERLGGLLKDNAGYAWPSLMIGSEGTLGIITSVLVRLVPRRAERIAALFAVAGVDQAMEPAVAILRRQAPSLEAADFFFHEGVELVERVVDGVRLPVTTANRLLRGRRMRRATDPTLELAEAAEAAEHLILDQAGGRRHRRATRDLGAAGGTPRGRVRAGVPVKVDVAVPLSAVARFVDDVSAVVTEVAPHARVVLWGTSATATCTSTSSAPEAASTTVEEQVLRLAAHLGGTVSAEHGVGVSKAKHSGLVCSAAELALLRALKDAATRPGS